MVVWSFVLKLPSAACHLPLCPCVWLCVPLLQWHTAFHGFTSASCAAAAWRAAKPQVLLLLSLILPLTAPRCFGALPPAVGAFTHLMLEHSSFCLLDLFAGLSGEAGSNTVARCVPQPPSGCQGLLHLTHSPSLWLVLTQGAWRHSLEFAAPPFPLLHIYGCY